MSQPISGRTRRRGKQASFLFQSSRSAKSINDNSHDEQLYSIPQIHPSKVTKPRVQRKKRQSLPGQWPSINTEYSDVASQVQTASKSQATDKKQRSFVSNSSFTRCEPESSTPINLDGLQKRSARSSLNVSHSQRQGTPRPIETKKQQSGPVNASFGEHELGYEEPESPPPPTPPSLQYEVITHNFIDTQTQEDDAEEEVLNGDIVIRDLPIIGPFRRRWQVKTYPELPCTQATEANAVHAQRVASLLQEDENSEEIYVALIQRLEWMLEHENELAQHDPSVKISFPGLASKLGDFLREIETGRISTGENQKMVELELKWVHWIETAAKSGVLHLKTDDCICRRYWLDADDQLSHYDELSD